jgi:hypothetical protein
VLDSLPQYIRFTWDSSPGKSFYFLASGTVADAQNPALGFPGGAALNTAYWQSFMVNDSSFVLKPPAKDSLGAPLSDAFSPSMSGSGKLSSYNLYKHPKTQMSMVGGFSALVRNDGSDILHAPQVVHGGDTWRMYNLKGNFVRKGEGTANLGDLPQGVYIVKQGTQSRKIVVR